MTNLRPARRFHPLSPTALLRNPRSVAALLAALLCGGCTAPGPPSPAKPAAAPATPSDLDRLGADAAAAYTRQDWTAAERLFATLTIAQPENTEAWFRLGNIYARTARHERAARAYDEALAHDPRHTRAWHNLGVVRMRLAALAFARLTESAAPDDPLRAHGELLGAGLTRLLEADSPAAPAR
jgi:Flp pilus assembly protein TadD